MVLVPASGEGGWSVPTVEQPPSAVSSPLPVSPTGPVSVFDEPVSVLTPESVVTVPVSECTPESVMPGPLSLLLLEQAVNAVAVPRTKRETNPRACA
jgi:hypothetical protein